MSLPADFRNGIAAIKAAFSSAFEEVQHLAWIAEDSKGKPVYAAPVSYPAFVEYIPQDRPGPGGQVIRASARVIFVEQLPSNGSPGRIEPIDLRDRLILPDGTMNPILEIGHIRDAETQQPYYLDIWLGTRRMGQG